MTLSSDLFSVTYEDKSFISTPSCRDAPLAGPESDNSSVLLKRKVIPEFKSEGRENAFWASHHSSEYLDWAKAQRALLPKLKR
jgi:hypothetical protein